MKCETFNLPTALISNTFDYGKYAMCDTTPYMRESIAVWEQLGFGFDAVCTGFIASDEQSQLVFDYCSRLKREKGTRIFVDPVMGDLGVLYKGISENIVPYMKKMCAISDLIIPNITEACFLSGFKAVPAAGGVKQEFSDADMDVIVSGLCELGAKSIVITSANIGGRACTVIRHDGQPGWKPLYYDEIPVEFSGTGDIFTSLVTSGMLYGADLETSVRSAMNVIERLIGENRDVLDKYKGVPIEQYLDTINPEYLNK